MSEIITFPLPGGPNYVIPDIGDENWGQNVTDFLVALPLGVPPTSGTFTLTGDLYFGASFGLVSTYFKSHVVNPADSGLLRLAKTDTVDWRNNLNNGNNVLAVNASDILTYNGSPLISSATGNLSGTGVDGIAITGGTGAVLGSGTTINQHIADTSHNGYLSFIDWNTFNSKGSGTVTSVAMTVPSFLSVANSPITSSGSLDITLSGTALATTSGGTGVTSLGNLTDVGTDGITIGSGTGAVIHNTTISQHVADSTHNGYLSSTDWATFNSAAGGGITSLTGDVTGTGPGATATTLATVNSNVGSFTNANVTVNAKGLITAASNGSSSGTVNSGTATHLSYYATSTNAVSDASGHTISGTYTYSGGAGAITMSSSTIAMGSNKITGLASPTANGDALAWGSNAQLGAGTISTPALTFAPATNCGFYEPNTGSVYFAANGGTDVYGYDNVTSLGFFAKGTTTNNNARAGDIGEYIESLQTTNTNFPGTGTFGDLNSITLTAGDWDITAIMTAAANSATVTVIQMGIGTASGNSATGIIRGVNKVEQFVATATTDSSSTVPVYRVSISGSTTYYQKYSANFSVATPQAVGRLSARRVR